MTTWDVFKRAERIEIVAAAIYAAFAKQFAVDAKVHGLFVRLEAEEVQHAARVRLLASRYRGDTKILEKVAGAAEIDACLAKAEAAYAEVSAGAWGSDLSAIKARLAQLEAQLSSAHAQVIAQDGNPSLRDFFRQLALQDDAHVALLLESP